MHIQGSRQKLGNSLSQFVPASIAVFKMDWHQDWDTRLKEWLLTPRQCSGGIRYIWKNRLQVMHNNWSNTQQTRHTLIIADRSHEFDFIVSINAFDGRTVLKAQGPFYLETPGNQLLSEFMTEFADISRITHSLVKSWLARRTPKGNGPKPTV
jgi:hypothetical protein